MNDMDVRRDIIDVQTHLQMILNAISDGRTLTDDEAQSLKLLWFTTNEIVRRFMVEITKE